MAGCEPAGEQQMTNEQEPMRIRMYATGSCPYCMMARRLLDYKGVEYELVRVDGAPERRREMESLSGRRTVPQIFIGPHHVGGFDELALLERTGRLDPLLAAATTTGE